MCCFEDSASHPQAKVANGRENEKWAISNFFSPLFFYLFTCTGCLSAQSNGGPKITELHLAGDKWSEM